MKQWQVRLQKSRSYKWWVLAVIMVGTFMAVLDVTVVNVGLPTTVMSFTSAFRRPSGSSRPI